MALFSNSAELDDRNKGIVQRMEQFYTDSILMNQQFWAEADIDTRFYVGDQTIWNQVYGQFPAFNRKQYNFNKIKRIVEMPSGYQRRNRKSTLVVPIENADQRTADQFTKIIAWNDQQEGVPEAISTAFRGALISGLNLLQVWMDYREDPISGNMRISVKSANSIVIDPFFKNPDLSDCNGIWTRSYVTRLQAKSLLPNYAEFIDGYGGQTATDGKFQYMPEQYANQTNTLLAYDEFYYRDYRSQKLVVDTVSGEKMEWKGDEDRLRDYLSMYPEITVIDQEIPTTKLAILINGRCAYDGPNPMGIDDYPFVPVLGYYQPELPYYSYRIQGMVRGLRDAQFLYNRRKIIELDILESQSNSGWLLKEDSLVDPKSAFKTGQGQVIWVKKEANMADIMPIQPASVSPGMLQVSEQLNREMLDISGVNEELLGSAVDDKAGILAQARQGAGLTTLQSLFDQLDQSQKLLGRLRIKLIQANFTPGKVQKIIKEQPSPEFYNKNFGIYDAAVEEGFNTTTQRQQQFAQLLYLREAGIEIPPAVLIEAATLQNKDKLIAALEQQQQAQQQMQQAQAQMQMQQQEATMQMAKARAAADIGLSVERQSRVQENASLAVEREAQAEKDKTDAILNIVKSLKELETMDLDNLMKALQMQQMISNQVKQDTQSVTLDLLSGMQNSGNNQQPMAEQPPVIGQ